MPYAIKTTPSPAKNMELYFDDDNNVQIPNKMIIKGFPFSILIYPSDF